MVQLSDLTNSLDEQAQKAQQEQDKTAQFDFLQTTSNQVISELKSLNRVLLASPIAKDKKVAGVAKKLASFIDQLDKSTSAIKGANFKPLASSLKSLDATLKALPPQIADAHQAVSPLPKLEEISQTLSSKNFSPVVKVAPPDLSSLITSLNSIKELLSKDTDKVDLTKLESLTGEMSTAVSGVKGAIEALRFPVPNYVLPFITQVGKAAQVKLDAAGNVPVTGSLTTSPSGTQNVQIVDGSNNGVTVTGNRLDVNATVSGGSGTSAADNSAFTAGTTSGTPAMGFYHSTIDTVTDGRTATVGITAKRGMLVNLQTSAGAETGIAALPLQVSLANTAANTAKLLVTPDSVALPANQSVNISQINGVTPLMGNGTTGTGSLRVTIASDNTAFAVNSTLSAETTKVIGTARTADGAGNLYTTNSTTYTAKFAQDSNLLGTLGTAFSTAGKVDVKGADGDVFVRQTTAGNLNATVVGTGTFAVQADVAKVNGVTTLVGNGVSGTGAQRVTIASDSTGQIAPAANATATGTSIYNNIALSATKQAVNASAGNLYGYHIYNPNSVVIYVQLFNVASASVTVGSTTPTMVLVIPALGWADSAYPVPINFGTALTVAATTTSTGSTAPTTALLTNIFYK